MRPHPRIRKTVKWGGAVVTVVLLVAWIGSGWAQVYWVDSGGAQAGIGSGRAFVLAGAYAKFGRGGRVYVRANSDYELMLTAHSEDISGVRMTAFPLWPLLLAGVVATAVAWRLDTLARRRAPAHACPKCRYDRTGLAPGAVCPECGAAAPVVVGAPTKGI